MRNYIAFILFIVVVLTSCRPKELKVKVDPAPSKLVVFAQVIPDNIMIITLTKSFSNLEGATEPSIENLLVSGATVKVFLNGKTFDFYELNPGIYASLDMVNEPNGIYTLLAYKDQDTVRSTAEMLPHITFNSVLPIVEKLETDTTVYVDVDFTDIPSIANWYMINIYRKGVDSTGFDALNFFSNGQNLLSRTELVSDKEFNGTYQKRLKIDNAFAQDSIVVTLSNISKTYFDYVGYRSSSGNIFNQLQLEPLTYPTNIINGYGFFNTHWPDVHFFDLSKF